jgi:hypothetical protein
MRAPRAELNDAGPNAVGNPMLTSQAHDVQLQLKNTLVVDYWNLRPNWA